MKERGPKLMILKNSPVVKVYICLFKRNHVYHSFIVHDHYFFTHSIHNGLREKEQQLSFIFLFKCLPKCKCTHRAHKKHEFEVVS